MEVLGEHGVVDVISEVGLMLLWVFAIARGGSLGSPIAQWFRGFLWGLGAGKGRAQGRYTGAHAAPSSGCSKAILCKDPCGSK